MGTPSERTRRRIRRRVLDWYAARGRPLAFRRTSDPWAILVSEVMAQQTQAARAAEAWERFIERWPTPGALAEAPVADVLRAWRGLGYNRRAVALHRAAQAIVADHAGAVPRGLEPLRRLPGIGPYSARAVAALAFGRPVGAVDTNVRRVLGRAFLGTATPDAADVQRLADAMVPRRDPGVWTHALMDIGATICRIRDPRCGECPLRSRCVSAPVLGAVGAQPTRASVARRAARSGAFTASSRWLRGRILDRLRDVDADGWLTFAEPIGDHGLDEIEAALTAMRHEGLIERAEVGLVARLPATRLGAAQLPVSPPPGREVVTLPG